MEKGFQVYCSYSVIQYADCGSEWKRKTVVQQNFRTADRNFANPVAPDKSRKFNAIVRFPMQFIIHIFHLNIPFSWPHSSATMNSNCDSSWAESHRFSSRVFSVCSLDWWITVVAGITFRTDSCGDASTQIKSNFSLTIGRIDVHWWVIILTHEREYVTNRNCTKKKKW